MTVSLADQAVKTQNKAKGDMSSDSKSSDLVDFQRPRISVELPSRAFYMMVPWVVL